MCGCVCRTHCVSIAELVVHGGLCKYYSQHKCSATRPHKGTDTLVKVWVWRGDKDKDKWLPSLFFHFLKHQSIGQPYLFSAESQNCCEQCYVQIPDRRFCLLQKFEPVFVKLLIIWDNKKSISHQSCLSCSSSLSNCPALLSLGKCLRMCRKMSCWTYFIYCFALDSSAVYNAMKKDETDPFFHFKQDTKTNDHLEMKATRFQ